MYTDEQFEQLEQEEREIAEEAILVMLAIIASVKSSLEKELRNFYQKYGKDGVVTWQDVRKWTSDKDHRRRLTVILLIIVEHFNMLHKQLTPEFRDFLIKIIEKELKFFDVEDIDFDLDDVFKKWGVDDSTWDERLAADVELWRNRTANEVKRSFLQQEDVEEAIETIIDIFDAIEKVLKKLAMTEATAVGSFIRKLIFDLCGIKKYRYYAREDERTCEVCGSLHGLVFPTSSFEVGVNASPMHPWCRCWEVPIKE